MKKTKKWILVGVACASFWQPMQAQRIQQPLGRGVVAVQNGDAITLTWRKLAQEPENVEYNVYCRASGGSYTKVNSSPLSQTNLQTTTSRVPVGSEVAVALVVNGVEGALSEPFLLKSHSVRGVFVDLSYDGFLNNAGYTTKFIWPADLTGDGEYDYVVDRLSTVDGVSDKVEAYTRDGKRLWTIDMGPNIRICQGHNDMVLAYDMNCDGKAEVVIKSSDGTRFWNSEANGWGAYLKNATNGDTDGDGIIDYSAQSVKNPPQYITVVDGLTGKEKSTVEMTYPSYSGNTYTRTNKSSYMDEEYSKLNGHMAVAYLDGVHPSVSMEYMVRTSDKNHHYYVSAWGYDFSTGEAGEWKEKFTWVRNNKSPWPAEFHHIRVADVNMDGHDEILDGGFAVAHTGNMLFSAGISHGDRFRVGDIDPDRPGLETFAIQQNAGDMLGQILYDAGTGEPIKKWYLSAVGDVGRGECIDVDPAHKGYEMWSTMGNLYNAKGDLISTASVPFPREGMWWDGELDREILAAPDGNGYNAMITKYNGSRLIEMARLSGWTAVAEYGTRPAFFGDIIGDWREEVILRKVESSVCTGIMGFSTDFSTNVSLYCLQENPAYRMQCTTRGYYQSPYPDYYLGYDMSTPPLPACMVTDLVWSNGSSWQQGGSGFTDFSRGKSAAYSDGKSVLFDISGSDVSAIELSGNLAPSVVYAMVPKGKEYVWSGSGSLSGEMEMWKSMNGRLVVNVPLQYSGVTHISEGTLELNGPIAGPLDLRAKGTLAGNAVLNGKVQFEDALNYEGARIQPGTPELPFGVITFNKDLLIDKQIYVELDLQNGENAQCDMLQINGNLTLASPFFIRFITGDSKPAAGEYSLMEWSGDLVGDISQISVKGLSGLAYSLEVVGKSLQLHIRGQRDASDGVAWMGYESGEWNYQLANFTLADEATEFVAGDVVRFDDEALQTSVTVNELIPTGGVVFDHSTNYTLTGEGGLSGSGGLTKRGSGKLTLASTKSDYTGVTRIEEGTVEVRELSDGGIASSFGASDAKSGNFVMGKAVLLVNNVNAATNRPLTLNDTAVVRVPSGVTSLKGIITGSGTLVKEGAGQLNITYGGANSYSGGTILKAGILAMGAWNTTFGQTGKKLYAEGGTIRIFNNNSTSAVPSFNYQLEVPSGKSVNLEAGDRCTIGGSMLGGGTVKLSIPYVRAEFLSTMTNFAGSLQVSGNQFRLCQSTDMGQTALVLNDGVYMAHFNQGSGNEKSGCTTRVGSLTSSVTTCTISTGTYNIGYDNSSTTYEGNFSSAATVNKYGTGTWSITNNLPIGINGRGGTVVLRSGSSLGGTSTIYSGGRMMGSGNIGHVVVREGGRLTGGLSDSFYGTINVDGNLTVNSGGILQVKKRSSRYDAFAVSGSIQLTSPVIEFVVLKDEFVAGDECTLFSGSGSLSVTGEPTFIPETPGENLEWDSSDFANTGRVRVKLSATGIASLRISQAKIWPTIVDEHCYVDLSEACEGDVQLTLQGLSGAVVQERLFNASSLQTLELGNLPSGTYVLVLRVGKQQFTQKLIKR